MISDHSLAVAARAKNLYEQQLRTALEAHHRDKYVAIEPDSGDYFVGSTYSESILSARKAHPQRISFVIRVGHDAAIHLGGMSH